jgi:hypothetical protein
MLIRPELGGRIFSGTAGAVLLILACTGVTIPFPGLIFTCLGLPLAVFAFGYAFGAAHTQIDEDGISQRNFFFVPKKFAWGEIESGKIVTESYNYKDSSGWTSRRSRTYVLYINKEGKKIYINAKSTGPEEWWDGMRRISKEKMGDRFEG